MNRITILTLDSLNWVPIPFTTQGYPDPSSIHELKGMTDEEEYQWCWDRGIQPADILACIGFNELGEQVYPLLRFKQGLRAHYVKMRNQK